MNPVDEKTVITQGKYELKERKDGRIILYEKGNPLYSFEKLLDLINRLDGL